MTIISEQERRIKDKFYPINVKQLPTPRIIRFLNHIINLRKTISHHNIDSVIVVVWSYSKLLQDYRRGRHLWELQEHY